MFATDLPLALLVVPATALILVVGFLLFAIYVMRGMEPRDRIHALLPLGMAFRAAVKPWTGSRHLGLDERRPPDAASATRRSQPEVLAGTSLQGLGRSDVVADEDVDLPVSGLGGDLVDGDTGEGGSRGVSGS